MRKRKERQRVPRLLARFNFFLLSLSSTCLPRSVPPVPSSSLHSPRGDKERDGEGKGTAKRRGQEGREGGGGGEATGEENGGGREVRKTCPSLHDPVHYLPRILTITKRYAPSRRSSDVMKSDDGSLNNVARKGRLFRKINTTACLLFQ